MALTHDAVVAGLYKAAHGEIDWRTALHAVTEITGCWVVQLMGVDLRTGCITYSYEGGTGEGEAIVEYVRRYHQIDPHLQYLLPLLPGNWYHSTDYFDDAAVAAHPFYQDFLIPYGDRYVSGMKVHQDDSSAVILGVHRALGTQPLDVDGRALVESMGFHIQQAVQLWRKQRHTLTQAAMGRELLNRMGSPVVLMDELRQIGLANDDAQSILSGGGPVFERGGYLGCLNARDDDNLTLALRSLQLGGRMGLGSEAALDRAFIRLEKAPGRLAVSLCLLAVRPESTMGAFGAQALAMVLVHDPNRKLQMNPFIVASAFDLSPAEARVAVALASGLVPKQIAINHNVALPTVRSQVASIYQKLGIKRAAELTALLTTGPFATLR